MASKMAAKSKKKLKIIFDSIKNFLRVKDLYIYIYISEASELRLTLVNYYKSVILVRKHMLWES